VERANPSSSRTTLLPGGTRVASRYTVEAVIGEGMSGVVYRALRDDGELVALKVIHRDLCSDDQIAKRFQREAQILKRIEGQHVVKLHDFVEEDGLVIIVLEYVDATSLEAVIGETPPTMDQAVEISLQVCAALGAAHAAGVVHRDLKPANVLIERLTKKSTGLCIRVVDFGLAKVVRGDLHSASPALTERDMIFGTPEYMAPEQVRGDDVDVRADIYAAGVMLYEMVVGRVPFSGRTPLETMDAHLSAEVPRPRASREGAVVPPALAAVILRALAKEPGQRYPSARAFAEALTAAWSERLVIAPHAVEDPDAMATNDTELNVNAARNAPHLTSTSLDPLTVSSPNALARSGGAGAAAAGRLFWIIAAIVALICMIIGVWIGIR
jgi:serine/threonine-protein kinase